MTGHDEATEHLAAAHNWLTLAEGNRGELFAHTEEGGKVTDAVGQYHLAMFDTAARLAAQHRRMAEALWSSPDQRIEVAPDADALMREAVAADVERYETETFQHSLQGYDLEPEGSEGDLLTLGEGWFLYATNGHASPNEGDQYAERWLLIRHYAQFLRWRDETRAKPTPLRWDELYRRLSEQGEPVIVARPTPEERAQFFGPEPDDVPETKPGQRVHAALADMRERETEDVTPGWVHTDGAGLGGLGDRELELLVTQIQAERARRTRDNGHDPLPDLSKPVSRPGSAQWREG